MPRVLLSPCFPIFLVSWNTGKVRAQYLYFICWSHIILGSLGLFLHCNVYVVCRPCRAAGFLRFPVCKDPLRIPLHLVIRGQKDSVFSACLTSVHLFRWRESWSSRIPSSQHELLASGGRYGAQRCKLNRFKNSFSLSVGALSRSLK